MNQLQKQIQNLHEEHMEILTELFSVMEELPNHGRDCDCGREQNLGLVDFDIDWDNGTVSVGCLECGGYVMV
jgi:hypothetical protein